MKGLKRRLLLLSGGSALGMLAWGAEPQSAVGFIQVKAAPGLQLIASPLDHSVNNTVTNLLTEVPEGAALFKFAGGQFTTNRFSAGTWSNPAETMNPGEGAFFLNPTTNILPLTFAGTLRTGRLTNTIPPGLSLKASLMTHSRALVTTDLGLKLARFDNLLQWKGTGFAVFTALPQDGWLPEEPQIAAGESFFINSAVGTEWIVSFSPNSMLAANGPGPVAAMAASQGGTVNFANGAAGVDAPVLASPGGERLEGPSWQAELLWVEGEKTLTRVAGPVALGTGSLAGYFFGGMVSVSNSAAGAAATFRIRVFNASIAAEGLSAPVTVLLGGGKAPPPNLAGLAAWRVPVTLPTLNAGRVANQVVLWWPGEFADWLLESTAGLRPPAWSQVTDPTEVVPTRVSVVLGTSGPQRYFRLRAP